MIKATETSSTFAKGGWKAASLATVITTSGGGGVTIHFDGTAAGTD